LPGCVCLSRLNYLAGHHHHDAQGKTHHLVRYLHRAPHQQSSTLIAVLQLLERLNVGAQTDVQVKKTIGVRDFDSIVVHGDSAHLECSRQRGGDVVFGQLRTL